MGKVRLGFEIRCDADASSNLQVTWPGNRFHMSDVVVDGCSGGAGPGEVSGEGTGLCNGAPATVRFSFESDAVAVEPGEPTGDVVRQLGIEGSAVGCALSISQSELGGGSFRFIDNPEL